MFALSKKASHVTEISKCETSERCWVLVRTEEGPYLLGCWHRLPKRGNLEGIEELRLEVNEKRKDAVGVVLIGDVNVHSEKWLKFSKGESPEGTLLHQVCDDLGLKQIVTEPTRFHEPTGEDNLLDLTFTDVPEATTTVGAKVIPLPEFPPSARMEWLVLEQAIVCSNCV